VKLYPRKILNKIEEVLDKEQWIILTGARQTGKTSLMLLLKDRLEKAGSNCSYFNLENPEYLSAFNSHPFNVFEFLPNLKSLHYVFIDEIQYLDDPSRFLKLLFDEKRDKIKIIASGSSSFYIDDKFQDSLAGRKLFFEIYPLDFEEFLIFNEEDGLLKKQKKTNSKYYWKKLSKYWKEYCKFGGYPRVVLAGEDDDFKKVMIEEILTSYIKKDVRDAGIKNSAKYFSLLKIFAQQTGGVVNVSELSNTLNLNMNTVGDYLYAMEKSYHIALVRPFFKNYRKEFTKMPKVYFFDQGLRNYLMNGLNIKNSGKSAGAWLENLFFTEMVKKTGRVGGIKYWRTQDKKEVDFVVNNKRAYEIKSNPNKADVKKYRTFRELYPDYDLKFITEGDILKEFYLGR
jgi:hypothetical protein